jgi:hypothetical protein
MAIISIPNSIGGVSIPGGLLKGPLGALFNKKNGQEVTQYPSDLASNPTRAHSVLFTIIDITPTNLTESKQTTLTPKGAAGGQANQAVPLGTQASNFVAGGVQKVQDVAGGVASGVSNAVKDTTISQTITATLKPNYKTITDSITLYMPETLNMSYDNSYQEFSLTSALGVGGRIAATVSDIFESRDSGFIDNVKNLASSTGSEVLGSLIDKKTQGGGDAKTADILLRANGYAVNPQLQLLYKGINLRTFQLEFLFTPKSQGEAKAVKTIIDKFTKASLPTIQGAIKGSTSGQYFTMPSIFNIKFQFHGGNNNTAVGAAMNAVLGNLGAVGSAITQSLNGNSTKGNENTYLYKVGDCVLENINVDYAPNGWAAYTDGSPVQTRMTLSFREMDIMHRERFSKGDVR